MKFVFEKIPVEVRWGVFDDAERTKCKRGKAGPGDSSIEIDVPDDYAEPFINVRCADGYTLLPDQRRALISADEVVVVDGSLFYADVDRQKHPYELNHDATKNLITGAQGLAGRARFFAALVALETHLEHLTFAMLVLSGHRTDAQFGRLNTQQDRTVEAFDGSNTAFFDDPVSLPGGRTIPIGEILPATRDEMRVIFDEVRKLRNNIVHAWTYKHPERSDLANRFQTMGEQLQTHHDTDDDFFEHATTVLVRLFARVNPLDGRASVFRERAIVEEERRNRGYT